MSKVIEKNVAELIMIGLVTVILLSSCGVQFGDYNHYRQVHGKPNTCAVYR